MICPRCGHRMDTEDANFCGRCGAPLRPSVLPPPDVGEPEPPDPLPALDVARVAAPEPFAPRDPLALTSADALLPAASLPRPSAGAPGAPEQATPPPELPAPFEAPLPSLALNAADLDRDALQTPDAADAGEPARQETAPAPPAALAVRATGPAGALRAGGCTLLIHAGRAPLVEVELEPGAQLTLAAGSLIWARPEMQIDSLTASGDGEGAARWAYLQASGPGDLAITAGALDTVTPLALAAGTTLDVAAAALLAWTRGVRVWRHGEEGSPAALRLRAARPALVLLRSACRPHGIDLPLGATLAVARDALLAAVDATDWAVLRRHDGAGPPRIEYRLGGPGRVLLGAPPVAARA